MRSYAHIATGNYHTRTARLYEDVGLLTANPVITNDVVTLFHFLTGRSRTPSFAKLLVAPLHMRSEFVRLVEREIENHASGRPATHRVQDEPARGRRDVRSALTCVTGRRPDRPDRPRPLLPRSRRPRLDREHPHPLDRRPLPRALAHLPFRRRLGRSARGGVPDRLGRLDAPQPLGAGRGRGPDPQALACARGSGRSWRSAWPIAGTRGSCRPTAATPSCSRTGTTASAPRGRTRR